MGKGSLFGRLADALKEKDDGPTNEEIDAEFDKAIAEIDKIKVDKVDAATILDPGYKVAGGMVYVINLTEIYKKIGGRDGRQSENLKETAARVFAENRGGAGSASFQGDRYLMQFDDVGESEGFHRAALIINEIGRHMLGTLFEEMEVPDFIIAAKAEDITDADGAINHALVDGVVADGGVPIDMGEPEEGSPTWMQMSWNNNKAALDIEAAATQASKSPFDDDDEEMEWRPVDRH